MTDFPNDMAYRERVRQAAEKKDEDAMGRALEDYARDVVRSRLDDTSKERMIREAREYLHKMWEDLDNEAQAAAS